MWFGLDNGQLAQGIVQNPMDVDENPATGLSEIRGMALAPGGGSLLIAGNGGIVVWSIDGRQLLARAVPRDGHSGASISPDGASLAVTTLGGALPTGIYDLTADPPRRRDVRSLVLESNYYYDDPLHRYVQEFDSGTSRYLDAGTFAERGRLADLSFISYSMDGRWLAAARWVAPQFRVVDTTTWQPVSPMIDLSPWASPGERDAVPGFDASGTRVFASLQNSGTTIVFDTTTWQPVQVIEPTDHRGVIAARFSHDGSVLVTLGIDGTIAQRDPQTWAVQRVLAGGVSATDNLDQGVHLSPDGQYLLTTRDRQPRLWHLPTATVIGAFPHRTGLLATGQDYGDALRLVTFDETHALVWNLDVTSWPEIACRAAGRNLSQDEWRQFGPKDVPYTGTCAQWPAAA
jgi:hypothetical protein